VIDARLTSDALPTHRGVDQLECRSAVRV